jgi:hypothetical protein
VADEVDFLLCCVDDSTASIAQHIRSVFVLEDGGRLDKDTVLTATASGTVVDRGISCKRWPCFALLPDGQRQLARKLGEMATAGRLTFFIGAGVSSGAGLPGWFSLLEQIEDELKPPGTPRSIGNDIGWDALKFADKLDSLCHTTSVPLKARIAKLVERHVPSLLMCLLAQMPRVNMVTQNYDQLAEIAADAVSCRERRVLQPSRKGARPVYGPKYSLSVIPCKSDIFSSICVSTGFVCDYFLTRNGITFRQFAKWRPSIPLQDARLRIEAGRHRDHQRRLFEL